MISPVPERRRHPRLDNNVPVKISCEDFDLVTETRNLSCSGAYCQVNKFLEPMTKLKIHLLLPLKKKDKVTTKKITCDGVVVRAESQPGDSRFNIAIYFSEMPIKDRKCLAEYIEVTLSSPQSNPA